MNVKQQPNESLRSYLAYFAEESIQIFYLKEQVTTAVIIHGLRPQHSVWSFTKTIHQHWMIFGKEPIGSSRVTSINQNEKLHRPPQSKIEGKSGQERTKHFGGIMV